MSNNSFFSDVDSYLFHQGTDYEAYKKLGAHPMERDGVEGTCLTYGRPTPNMFLSSPPKPAGKTNNG